MIGGHETCAGDFEKCPACDAMVDLTSLIDVVLHFIDGACVGSGERRVELSGVRGERVDADA